MRFVRETKVSVHDFHVVVAGGGPVGYPNVTSSNGLDCSLRPASRRLSFQKLNKELVAAMTRDEARQIVPPQVASVITGAPDDLAALVARGLARIVKGFGTALQ
jgi:hypothetical protein